MGARLLLVVMVLAARCFAMIQGWPSATGSSRSTNGAGGHTAIGMIGRSSWKTHSLRRHKPPDPVSTKRGQAQSGSPPTRSTLINHIQCRRVAPGFDRQRPRSLGNSIPGEVVELLSTRRWVTIAQLVSLSPREGNSEVVRPDLEGFAAPIVVEVVAKAVKSCPDPGVDGEDEVLGARRGPDKLDSAVLGRGQAADVAESFQIPKQPGHKPGRNVQPSREFADSPAPRGRAHELHESLKGQWIQPDSAGLVVDYPECTAHQVPCVGDRAELGVGELRCHAYAPRRGGTAIARVVGR